MATIKDVAKRAGVSVGTVSNVISGGAGVSVALREKVWQAIRELNYHPNHVARSLKIKQTKLLGMVISDITNPFFPMVTRGAEDVAMEHGYMQITLNTDDQLDRERQVLSVLRSRGVDGILLVVAPNGGDNTHIEDIINVGIPIVCLDRVPDGLATDSVSGDSVAGAQVCIRHLITSGHTRIGIITGSLSLQTARDRLRGYEAALREADIPIDPDLICEGDFHVETGYRMAKELFLRHKPPTALFVSNAMMMFGTLRALEETGLQCPGDIALATFDDLPGFDVCRPRLTAVSQPAYEMGRLGAELLIRRIEEDGAGSAPKVIRLNPELKIRESTSGARRRVNRPALSATS